MEFLLSKRVQRVKTSPTLAVSAKAIELRAAGQDIISLGSGEPDFDTPEHIKLAAKQAIDEGKTRYTPVDGIVELKQAVIDKFAHDNNLQYQLDEVIVGVGGKQLIYNLFQAVLNPGDEVLIPTPYWVSYPDMAYLADAASVFMPTGIDQQYKVTAQQLSDAITDKSKLLVLNSPSNPTGAMYNATELRQLAEVLQDHPNLIIASDDIYEKIILGEEKYVSILDAMPQLKNRTVMLNGVSKAYAMTGWRIGYAGGPAFIIKAMKKIQSQSTSNPTSISQYAALAALQGDQSFIQKMNLEFARRNRFVVDQLNSIEGVKCFYATGAFYAFADFSKIIERMTDIDNDVDLAEYVLQQAGIALVPGSAFGNAGYLRLSCATNMDNLEVALTKIKKIFLSH